MHVVEHISDINHLACEIRRVLKANGCMYIEVPSIFSVFAPTSLKFFAMSGNFFDDITHKRILNKVSLSDFAERYCGTQRIRVGTTRNWAKILCIPFLLLLSMLKQKNYISIGLSELFGWKLYIVSRKQ
jgi:hypothetical protein